MPFITQGKTNILYLLTVIIVAIIVGTGLLYYYYLWIVELETKLAKLELRVPRNETADWKIYRNEEYGFEIKYPMSWFAYNDTKLGFAAISTFSQEKYEKYFGTTDKEKLGENYGLIHIDYIAGKPLEEIFESAKRIIEKTQEIPGAPFKIKEFATNEINIGGSKGYGLYYRTIYPEQAYYKEGVYGIYLILDKHSEGIIGFEGKFTGIDIDKNKETYKKYAKNFSQMISTFKFLE